MPKTPPPPTKQQLKADALIASPTPTTVRELSAAISALKKVYLWPMGTRARQHALRSKLDEHYAGLTALLGSTDKKVATAALRALPPALRPKPTKRRA